MTENKSFMEWLEDMDMSGPKDGNAISVLGQSIDLGCILKTCYEQGHGRERAKAIINRLIDLYFDFQPDCNAFMENQRKRLVRHARDCFDSFPSLENKKMLNAAYGQTVAPGHFKALELKIANEIVKNKKLVKIFKKLRPREFKIFLLKKYPDRVFSTAIAWGIIYHVGRLLKQKSKKAKK